MTHSREIIDIFLNLKKPFKVGFFLDAIKARAFKLYMIITLLGVYSNILKFDNLDFVSRS